MSAVCARLILIVFGVFFLSVTHMSDLRAKFDEVNIRLRGHTVEFCNRLKSRRHSLVAILPVEQQLKPENRV